MGYVVWEKAAKNARARGLVYREHKFPESYWVKTGSSGILRNRKHLFFLNTTEFSTLPAKASRPADHMGASLQTICITDTGDC